MSDPKTKGLFQQGWRNSNFPTPFATILRHSLQENRNFCLATGLSRQIGRACLLVRLTYFVTIRELEDAQVLIVDIARIFNITIQHSFLRSDHQFDKICRMIYMKYHKYSISSMLIIKDTKSLVLKNYSL